MGRECRIIDFLKFHLKQMLTKGKIVFGSFTIRNYPTNIIKMIFKL